MNNVAEHSGLAALSPYPYPRASEPVLASLWRGILLVEPDVALLTAETLLLTDSNYSVTPVFSQRDIVALRETKAIALAILSDYFGPHLLTAIAHTVRKQWPLARILVIGRPHSMLEDYLYDEQVDHSSDPKQLLEDVERLYRDSWNQRSYTLNWDARRAGNSKARSPIVESDPSKELAPARAGEKILRDTPSAIRYRPSSNPTPHRAPHGTTGR